MKKPDTHKIDLLLQYTLLVAGREDWGSRELGMIHLIKYLYLADLAYSEHHNGQTYTGLNWKFYHFGPWSEELYQRIEPALLSIGAEKKVYPSTKYEKDCVRWLIQNDEMFEELDSELSIILTGAVQRLVHKFGSDTEGILHFVYKTVPMLQASPGEMLDFTPHTSSDQQSEQAQEEDTTSTPLTARQLKKRKEKLSVIRKHLKERLDEKKKQVRFIPTPPRYDDVFFEGVKYLDSLAGEPIEPLEGTLIIADSVWKSKARFDPDVP